MTGRDDVAGELRRYAAELAASGDAQVGEAFTDVPEADLLVKSSPEAFLLGVLFTQGIRAEKAWAGPYLLQQRLGHLDLSRLASDRAVVDAAMCAPPALHRFKHTVAGWVSDAAARVLDCYGGEAARIWEPGSTVVDVTERLSQFRGVGRKKAAMAVEILRRHFGVELGGAGSSAIAYDVHVRRVFLRSGLVARDDAGSVAAAARDACPDDPGSIDLATWLVGRRWCRPKRPLCEECRLGGVCARLTGLDVEGVGARPRVQKEPGDGPEHHSSVLKSRPDSNFG